VGVRENFESPVEKPELGGGHDLHETKTLAPQKKEGSPDQEKILTF